MTTVGPWARYSAHSGVMALWECASFFTKAVTDFFLRDIGEGLWTRGLNLPIVSRTCGWDTPLGETIGRHSVVSNWTVGNSEFTGIRTYGSMWKRGVAVVMITKPGPSVNAEK